MLNLFRKSFFDFFCDLLLGHSSLFHDFFIFIFNTDGNKGKSVSHFLSQAMKSRCKNISFDVRSCENEEVLEKAISLYQHLDKDLVNDLLPDHRQLQRENQLAELIG